MRNCLKTFKNRSPIIAFRVAKAMIKEFSLDKGHGGIC